MFNQLLDINSWRKNLGYFPHTLFQKKHLHQKYVLLNGKGGNYCIDYTEENPDKCRSYAWSANVGHYITISGDKLKVYRWDKLSPTDELPVARVIDRIESFNDYISQQKIDLSNDSINLSLQLYRELRGSLRDQEGSKALSALLCAFACFEDDTSINELNKKKWGLSDTALEIANQIGQNTWDSIKTTLNNGISSLKIKPEIEILLRHASGKIFQEAHFESVFPSQLQFDFGFPNPSKGKKSTSGFSSHYTPTSIVRSVVEETLRGIDFLDKKEIIVFDPAVGSGEFLKETLRQISLKEYDGKIKLVGWDISSTAIDLANFSLAFEKQAVKTPSRIEIILETKNALTKGDSWSVQADVILMNPPFVSWENMVEDQRSRVSDILKDHLKGRPNEAGAFLWKAANSLNPNGRLGCIVPSSILEADSFLKLRTVLTDILHIDFLGKLGSHLIYEDAISRTSILISSKPSSDKVTQLMWSDNSIDGYASGLRELRKVTSILKPYSPFVLPGANYNFYTIDKLDNKNWTPVDINAYQLINVRLSSMKKVKDLFEIKQGVRTGFNKAFIIDKGLYETFGRSEQKYFKKAVTNDSINFGRLNDNAYIFYAEGKNSIKNERELKVVIPTFYKMVFSKYIEQLSSRSRRSMDNYWRLTEHRKWQLDFKPKIVSKEFGLAGAFAFDEKGVYVAERSHAWLPLQTNNWTEIGHGYVAILSMNIINELLKGLSKQISTDVYYLSSQFLNDMPLPNLFDNSVDIKIKNELIKIGKILSTGDFDNNTRGRLEALTDKLF